MNKNLLIGLAIGLGAYYLLTKVGKKKCPCEASQNTAITQPSEDQVFCEKQVDDKMKAMRFISSEASKEFRANSIADCLKNKAQQK